MFDVSDNNLCNIQVCLRSARMVLLLLFRSQNMLFCAFLSAFPCSCYIPILFHLHFSIYFSACSSFGEQAPESTNQTTLFKVYLSMSPTMFQSAKPKYTKNKECLHFKLHVEIMNIFLVQSLGSGFFALA